MTINPRPLAVCCVLAVPTLAIAAVLHDRPAPDQVSTLDPPVFVVHDVTTAVPTTGAPPVVSAPPAPAVVTQTADRGIMIQVTDTVPPPSTTWPRHPHYDIWLRLQECESGHLGWTANTGNGYYGGLQFGIVSWRGVGGQGWPHQASIWEQMFRAELLLGEQGWGAWPTCSRKLGLL